MMSLFLILLTSFVFASSVSVTNINIEETTEENESITVTITNNGNDALTDLQVTRGTIPANFPFEITTPLSTTDIAVGESAQFTATFGIPASNQDISLNPKRTYQLQITATNSTSQTAIFNADVDYEIESKIEIKDVDVAFQDKTEDIDNNNKNTGDDVKDVKRGDSVSVTIEIKNNFRSSTDRDMDLVVEFDTDLSVDIDEDSKDLSIYAGDSESIDFNFRVEDDAEDGKEDAFIKISGEDDNGNYYERTFTFEIEVDVPSREILLRDIDFTPSIVACDRKTTLYLTLKNTGGNDLEEAMVHVESDDESIGFDEWEKEIIIDTENSRDLRFDVNIPEDLQEGNYLFNLNAYTKGSTSSSYNTDTQIAYLEVADCVSTKTDQNDDTDDVYTPPTDNDQQNNQYTDQNDDNFVVNEPVNTPNTNTGTVVIPQKSSGFSMENTGLVVLLVIVNLLLIGGISFFINMVFFNKK